MPTDYSLFKKKYTSMCNKTEIPNAAVGLFPPFMLLNLAPCSTLYFFLRKVCLQYQNVKFFSPSHLA